MMIIDIEKNKNAGYAEEIKILKQFKNELNYIFYKIKNKKNGYNIDFYEEIHNLDLDNFINKI